MSDWKNEVLPGRLSRFIEKPLDPRDPSSPIRRKDIGLALGSGIVQVFEDGASTDRAAGYLVTIIDHPPESFYSDFDSETESSCTSAEDDSSEMEGESEEESDEEIGEEGEEEGEEEGAENAGGTHIFEALQRIDLKDDYYNYRWVGKGDAHGPAASVRGACRLWCTRLRRRAGYCGSFENPPRNEGRIQLFCLLGDVRRRGEGSIPYLAGHQCRSLERRRTFGCQNEVSNVYLWSRKFKSRR
jgi:hypothetical protein